MSTRPLFLVTGVGHSGTAFMARLFTELGFECGHERWHNLRPYRGMETPDSSGLAVPNLDQIGDIPVVHVVRGPLKVLRSVMRSRVYGPEKHIRPYNRFIARHLGQDLSDPLFDRMIHFVAEWDRPVEAHPRRMLVRVDRDGPEQMAEAVRHATGQHVEVDAVAEVMARLGTKVNAHGERFRFHDARIDWQRVLARPYGQRLAERAERYGYR